MSHKLKNYLFKLAKYFSSIKIMPEKNEVLVWGEIVHHKIHCKENAVNMNL